MAMVDEILARAYWRDRGVPSIVARLFSESIRRILARLIPEDLSAAWHRYVVFALYVVGVSGGVRIYELEQYVEHVLRVAVGDAAGLGARPVGPVVRWRSTSCPAIRHWRRCSMPVSLTRC